MNKVIFMCMMSVCYLTAYSQLTIEACYARARENYPLIKQYNLIEKTKEYNLSNASKAYLPQISFSAKASYQSEVTKVQLSIPGVEVEGLSKDQYGATIDVSQTVWDGGVVKSRQASVATESDVEKTNLEVNLYAINERVNQLYFGILLFDERIGQNKLLQEELQRTFEKVNAYVVNGVASQSDLDAVKVEQIKAKQSESQLMYTRKAYREMLSALTGENIGEKQEFVKPSASHLLTTQIERPELMMFNAQIKNLEAREQELNAGLMPKIGLFVTGGYARPGLNMLENEFSAYYIGGVRLSWNLSSLYTNKNNKKLIKTGISTVETQRETFLFNTNLDVSNKKNEVDKYREQLRFDDEIVTLRNSVKKASEAKMMNGTISGIDLMRDVNAEDMAKQDKILHEIEMLLAIYNLKYITNN